MSTDNAARQEWISLLALADRSLLRTVWDGLAERPSYRVVRGPEIGLIMVRARAGNTGARFNLGEMSVTRCTVALDGGVMGHAWIAGTEVEHARLAAVFDALLQAQDPTRKLARSLLGALRQARAADLAKRRAEVRPSRVDFFTLVRGED
jgi:alpha-D-ribose 1-methylphosphonate 5-triphosphate synthase subunit PhnG